MFKKFLSAVLVASMLILPVGSISPNDHEPAQDYLPGDVPAQTGAAESMTPALHALLLAMLNHNVTDFDFSDRELTWEGLYNMLSLYGQLDSRCDPQSGELFLPEETVWDYAAALAVTPETLGEPPAVLRDRMNYDNVSRCYLLICGEDDLVQVQVDDLQTEGARIILTGSLIYEVEQETLVRFQAALQLQDNMFGYTVSSLTLVS